MFISGFYKIGRFLKFWIVSNKQKVKVKVDRMPKSPKSQVPNTLRQKLGKGLWLPVFVAVGFIAFNRILANKYVFT